MAKHRQRGVVSEIDHYTHEKFKIKVPISLNKETGKFFAEYQNKAFHSDTLPAIKTAIHDFIHATANLVWIPIIEISIDGDSLTITDAINRDMHNEEPYQRKHMRVDGNLHLTAKRYWITKRQDGVWMECEIWDSIDYEAEGKKREGGFYEADDRRINIHEFYPARFEKDFSLPFTAVKSSFEKDENHYVPYDESTWTALNAIGDKIGELHKQLNTLVGTDTGRLKLQAFAQRLLPEPKKGK